MMMRIVPGYTTDHRPLDATLCFGWVGCAQNTDSQNCTRKKGLHDHTR